MSQKGRIIFMTACATLWFVVLAIFLFRVQVLNKPALPILAMNKTKDPVPYNTVLHAKRGNIYDRYGFSHPIVTCLPVWNISIDPRMVSDLVKISITRRDRSNAMKRKSSLSGKVRNLFRKPQPKIFDERTDEEIDTEVRTRIMNEFFKFEEFDKDLVCNAVMRTSGYCPVGETFNRDFLKHASTNYYLRNCVRQDYINRRNYIHGGYMSHIVGAINCLTNGPLAGVEVTMHKYLTGSNGYIRGFASGRREEIVSMREEKVEAVDGNHVFLTIDQSVQYCIEAELDDAMEEH